LAGCSRTNPACTQGENCAGICVHRGEHAPQNEPSKQDKLPAAALLTRATAVQMHTYQPCGGHQASAKSCPGGERCIDDPRWGGCGVKCHAPGICAKQTFCGGFAGIKCKDGKRCYDMPSGGCDVKKGGADCGGICL
jgi:hypothetical protein